MSSNDNSTLGNKIYNTWEKLAIPFAVATGAAVGIGLLHRMGATMIPDGSTMALKALVYGTGAYTGLSVGVLSKKLGGAFMKSVTETPQRPEPPEDRNVPHFIM